jgi:DNA-binding SARP family transcriptional activator
MSSTSLRELSVTADNSVAVRWNAHIGGFPMASIASVGQAPASGRSAQQPTTDPAGNWPVFIRLFGSFDLLKNGAAVELRPGGKAEALLSVLALTSPDGISRDELVDAVWPSSEPPLAGHSLNALVSSLHRQFGDVLDGGGLVVRSAALYRLNFQAGVGLDIAAFEAAADEGDRALRTGDTDASRGAYQRAAAFYRGDLCIGSDVRRVLERERLRLRYLTIQAALADAYFAEAEYRAALERSLDLLAHDPCREDAHRLAIRCYVRLGERSQALRQYTICRTILRAEFEAEPEAATTALFDLVREQPDAV